MPVLTGGLFSLGASGTIGKALTFSRWKGIKYARTRVIPANPRTLPQTYIRTVFEALSKYWAQSSTAGQAPWISAVKGKPLTARNLLVRENAKILYDSHTTHSFVASPGTPGLPSATTPVLTAGSGSVTIAATAPTAPPNWSITDWFAQTYDSFDARTNTVPFAPITYATGSGGTIAHTITGLDTGTEVEVEIWYSMTHSVTGEIGYTRSAGDHITTL